MSLKASFTGWSLKSVDVGVQRGVTQVLRIATPFINYTISLAKGLAYINIQLP